MTKIPLAWSDAMALAPFSQSMSYTATACVRSVEESCQSQVMPAAGFHHEPPSLAVPPVFATPPEFALPPAFAEPPVPDPPAPGRPPAFVVPPFPVPPAFVEPPDPGSPPYDPPVLGALVLVPPFAVVPATPPFDALIPPAFVEP